MWEILKVDWLDFHRGLKQERRKVTGLDALWVQMWEILKADWLDAPWDLTWEILKVNGMDLHLGFD